MADTGIHAKHWTREQVIEYGFTPQETERYIVWPGQATWYMVGQLRILELREQAKAALGAKFSIKLSTTSSCAAARCRSTFSPGRSPPGWRPPRRSETPNAQLLTPNV